MSAVESYSAKTIEKLEIQIFHDSRQPSDVRFNYNFMLYQRVKSEIFQLSIQQTFKRI